MIARIYTKIITLFCLVLLSGSSYSQFGPPNISGLALWLKADSLVTITGGKVSQWGDCSGNGVNALPVSGQTNPTLSSAPELNGKPTILFNGSTDGLGSAINIPAFGDSSLTIFFLVKGYNQPGGITAGLLNVGDIFTGQWLARDMIDQSFVDYSHYNGTGGYFDVLGDLPNSGFPYKVLTVQKNLNLNMKMDTAGVLAGLTTTSGFSTPFTNTPYTVGFSTGQNTLNGEIAEIIVYTKTLAPVDSAKIMSYLRKKYTAPPVSLGPNVTQTNTVCPDTIRPTHTYAQYLWSNGATTPFIIPTSSGTYTVTVTDAFSITSSASQTVSLINVNLNKPALDTVCQGGTFSFGTQITNLTPFTFLWSTGATTATISAPASPTGATVAYQVTVSDSFHCSKASNIASLVTDTFTRTVSMAPNQSLCQGNFLGLTTPSGGWASLQFHWSQGNATTTTIPISVAGNYSVTVTDASGCSGSASTSVSVSGVAPSTAFTANASQCFGFPFSPSNTTTGTVTGQLWNFGDGNTDTAKNPVHYFATPGTYTVTLKATGNGGCFNTVSHTVTINPKPVAAFTAPTACTSAPYPFADLSTVSGGNTIVQWNWNFGDTHTSNSQNPGHQYAATGTDAITLIVTTNNGCIDTVTHNITVVGSYSPPLVTLLQSPANHAAIQLPAITFKWFASANALNYTLIVSTDSNFISGNQVYTNLTTLQYPLNLSSNQAYYWKVNAYNICHDSTVSLTYRFSIFRPDNLPGLSLWLRADSGVIVSGSNVTMWKDGSGYGIDASVPSGQTAPTLGTAPEFLNKPTIKFNGSTNGLASTLNIPHYGDSSQTIFMLVKGYNQTTLGTAGFLNVGPDVAHGEWLARDIYNGSFTDYCLYNGAGGHDDAIGAAPNAGFPYKIFGIQKTLNVSLKMDTNGGLALADNSISGMYSSSPLLNAPYTVGYSTGQLTLNGEIPEIIVYTKALSDPQRHQVESYLYDKYSPAVDLGPDTVEVGTFCPVTLSPGTRFISYAWSTGATTPTIQATASGTYSVTVVDVFNRTSTSTIHVTLQNTMSLNSPGASICAGSSIALMPQMPSFAGYKFLWSDGDTTSSTNATTSGNYHVRVTDALGCTINSDTIAIAVDNFANTLTLGHDTTMCSGNSLGLSYPSTGWGSLTFHWSQGGASTSTIPITANGHYTVTVTDANTCSGTSSVNITVSGTAPVVTFTSSPTLCLGQAFVPNITSTAAGITFKWNFGDGTTSTFLNPSHTYAATGTYTVTLSGTNSQSCTNIAGAQVIINAVPSAAFNASTACANNSYRFADLSTPPAGGTLTQWQWNFGDGTGTSMQQNPAYTYTAARPNDTVTLTVTGSDGCTSTISDTLAVVSTYPTPLTPSLQAPVNNAAVQTNAINFKWGAAANAQNYTLTVSTDPNFLSGDSTYTGITALHYVVNLPPHQTYYWKVTAYNICNNSAVSVIDTFSIFRPDNLRGLALWLRADTAVVHTGSTVTGWQDGSGNSVNATVATGQTAPTLSSAPEFLNKPTIRFDGVSNGLASMGNIPGYGDSSLTVFILSKGYNQTTGATAGLLNVGNIFTGQWLARDMATSSFTDYSGYNGAGGHDDIFGAAPNTGYPYKIFGVQKTIGVSLKLDTNGGLALQDNSITGLFAPFTNSPYNVGFSSGDQTLKGEIPEIIVYTTALPDVQRHQVENYLYNKYSPPVDLGPDRTQNYSFCPVVLNPGTRFISYLWSTGATTDSITVTQSGVYSVSTVDVFNRSSSSTVRVTVQAPLTLNSTGASFCSGSSINLMPQMASLNGYTFLWSNGLTTSSINAASSGNYFVKVSDSFGCSRYSDTIIIHSDNFASTVSLGTDTQMCSGNSLGLAAPSGGWGSLQFHWSPNNEITSTIQITATGQYSVIVTDSNGCQGNASVHVNIVGTAPVVSFTAPTSLCFGQTFAPQITSSTTGDSIRWNFGDGDSSHLVSPTHIYSSTGNYTVLLKVSNGACANYASAPLAVNAVPVAAFNVGTACTGNAYRFADMSTPPTGGTLSNWQWNFGDGTGNSTQQNPAYTYTTTSPADTVVLTVTGNDGCTASVSHIISVVNTFTAPIAPPLQAPVNNAALQSPLITFKWGVSANAQSYTLTVSTDPAFITGDSVYSAITALQYTTTLQAGQTYYWKVTAYNICGNTAVSVIDTVSIFRPDNFAGLALWLRADSGLVAPGNVVSTWHDGSGNNIDATVASTMTAPKRTTAPEFLNMPTVKFNGINDGLASTLNIPGYADSSLTVFILSKGYNQPTGNTAGLLNVGNIFTGQWLARDMVDGSFTDYSGYNGSGGNLNITGAAPDAGYPYKIYGVQKNLGVNLKLDTNGGLAATDNSHSGLFAPFANGPYNVGFSSGDKTLNGEIPEIIVYTTLLTDPQRHMVENYLYNKYSPPVDLGPDRVQAYSYCPVTLNPGTRFISYLWSNGATTDSIIVTASGTYSVAVVDVFNRTSSSTVHVTLRPAITLNSGNASFCAGSSISLAPQMSSFNGYTFKWNNNLTTSSISATTSGNYFVTVKDSVGCSQNSDTIVITSDAFGSSVSLGPDTTMCAGNSLGLATPSSGWSGLTFHWSNNATGSTIPIITGGLYAVTVTDANGCSRTSSINITVSGVAPVVSFTASPALCFGQPYIPQITSTTSGISFIWNFGDTQTDTSHSPSHNYADTGTFNVSLKGTSGVCSNYANAQVVINPVPVAAFNIGTVCTRSGYQFTDLSTMPAGTLTRWKWYFGNGDSSSLQNPVYTYPAIGHDVVTLTVTGSDGCTATVSHSDTVVNHFTTPQIPSLQAPVNNAAVQSQLINFKWGVSAHAQHYTLTVSTDPAFVSGDSVYTGLTALQYPLTLPPAQTYYWKVTAYNICGDSAISVSDTFSIFSPNNIPGLALWLKADSGVIHTGSSVSTWHDASGNGIDAGLVSGYTPPSLTTAPEFLNMPTIRFNGVSDGLGSSLNIPGFDSSSQTIFILAKGYSQTIGTTAGFLTVGDIFHGQWLVRDMADSSFTDYSLYNGSGGHIGATGVAPNIGFPYKIFGFQKDLGVDLKIDTNSGLALLYNGSFTGLYSPIANAPYNVGFSSTDKTLNGEIPEIIVYTTALTATQKTMVQNYLYNKYSPPVDLGPDQVEAYSLCPKTLDPGSRFISYLWSTGATSQTIQVAQSGTYSITTVDVFNRTSSSTVHITLPTLNLNMPDTAICLGHSIVAQPLLSSLNGYKYFWSTFDTSSSIIVSRPGRYYVIVTDTTPGHCRLTSPISAVTIDSFRNTVSLGPDTSLCFGNTLGLASPAPSTWSSLQFNWSTGATMSTIIVGASSQQYLVTVANSRGCIGNSSVNVSIRGVAPTLNFVGDTFCLGQTYNPHNSTDTLSQQIVSYHWNFGDGTSANTYNPTHVYTTAGIKNATLTIANNAGCTNDLTKQVLVKQVPIAAFNTGQACIANSYQFTDLSIPPYGSSLTSWNWDFGDGSNSTAQNPTDTYNTAISYTVTLTVGASNGCSNTATGIIQVVSSTTLPPPAILEVPLNNSVWDTSLVTFSWIASPGASGYSVIVSTDPTFGSNVSHFNNIASTQFITTLTTNQQYYWRVVSYNICGQASISQTFSFNIFNPANLGGLALWLKGDDGAVDSTGGVSVWNDRSGNGINAYQPNANNQPTLVTENLLDFKPAVKFNGVSDVLTSTGFLPGGDSSFSVFIVGNGLAQTGSYAGYLTVGPVSSGLWFLRTMIPRYQDFQMLNNNGAPGIGGGVFDFGGTSASNSGYPFKMFEVEKNLAVEDSGYVNGTLAIFNNDRGLCGPFTNAPYSVGQAAGYSTLNGEIAEIIVYNTRLSPVQRQLVENYIYNKYAPPVNLGPDINRLYGLCPVVLDAQNRFVNYIWSTNDTTPTITVTKSGTYWVRTIDVFGRESSDTVHVSLPYHGVNPVDTSICFGQSVNVTQVIGHPYLYSYVWQDGSTINPLTTGAPGLYYAQITDSNFCTINSDTARVKIDSFNALALLPADTNICSGSGVSLHTTGYPVTSYLWSPGNDTTASPVINVAGPVTYYVTATDLNGCVSHDSVIVTTHGNAPVTNFSITNFCANDTIKFTDQSQPGSGDVVNAWSWNFGDTSTGTGTPAQHLYGVPGSFDVSLFIKTQNGCTGAKTINTTIYPSPKAAFTFVGSNPAIPYAICEGNYTIFTDVTPLIDSVTGRTWIIDGVTNAATQPQFQYRLPNRANEVALQVTSNRGCTNTQTQHIDVFPALVADFKYTGACLGDTTVFTDITHSLSLESWEWQFGDSIIGLQQNERHIYATTGSYNVTLTVENVIGCIDHQTRLVNIVPNPVADFSAGIACKQHYLTPADSSTIAFGDPVAHWNWNFGGTLNNNKNPQYLLADTGALQVSFSITTQSGCKSSVSKTIEVEPNPLAFFTYTPLYGSAPVDVSFNNLSSGATTYTWDFGDGATSVEDTPSHTYSQNGNYTIVLYAQNNFGCTDSSAKTFVVVPTDLDLSVDGVSTYSVAQPDGSSLVSVVVRCSNLGTRVITSAQFFATIGTGGLLEENWKGTLPSGQIMVDTFAANFVTTSGNPGTYVCVAARNVNNGETETRYDNNEACTSLDGNLQLVGPWPNPAIRNSALGLILPKAGKVTIDIVDGIGNYVIHQYNLNLPVGRSDFNLPVELMAASEYFIRVSYNDETQVRKLVVR